jgi:uncharacterized protein
VNPNLVNKLTALSQERQKKDDPSHDFEHVLRVLNLAVKIGKSVGADLDIVIPAALFHDTIVYKKTLPESQHESDESAEIAAEILRSLPEYPQEKIEQVKKCISECSFAKGVVPDSLESQALQDADRLEATGALGIMRTFAYMGYVHSPLYPHDDPLVKAGAVNLRSGIDFFYTRLLLVEKTMHTKLGKEIAHTRGRFLETFLDEYKRELIESGIILE